MILRPAELEESNQTSYRELMKRDGKDDDDDRESTARHLQHKSGLAISVPAITFPINHERELALTFILAAWRQA